MADGAFKTVGSRGKVVNEEDVQIKKEEKRLRDEGKLTFIRLERNVKENETFDFTAAATMAIEAAVNNLDDTVLVSIDGKTEMKQFRGFSNNAHAEKYFNPIKASLKSSTRFALVIKIRTETSNFFDIKNTAEMMEVLNKWNWTMRRHDLSPGQPDVRLVFNIFKVNPYLIGKNEHTKLIDKEVKSYAKTAISKSSN